MGSCSLESGSVSTAPTSPEASGVAGEAHTRPGFVSPSHPWALQPCVRSQVLISPGRHLHLLLPQAVLPAISGVCFFVFFRLTRRVSVLPLAGEMPALKFSVPWGCGHTWCLLLWACRSREPWLPDGLTLGARGRWVSFFFTPAPGRLQLAGLQPGEGLGLESALRLFVERESAKCHRDFCPLALQALPAREPRASGQIHRQIQGRAGVQGCVGGP